MQQTTYDPILETEDLSAFRLLSPLRPPAPGRALVLVPHSGPALTVRPGEAIPSSRFGAYQTAYTVDTGDHRLVLDLPLLSRDATFAFQSSVALTCRVTDPAAVVARGIRDMSAALVEHMRRMLRQVSRRYDIAEFHEAEEALNEAVRDFEGDDAVRLSSLHVELLVDADEVSSSGRQFRDVVRESRLAGMRRQRHLDMMRADGVEGLIAEILEKDGAAAAMAYIEKAEAAERAELRDTLRMILERGDKDREPFEIAEAERAVLGRVLGGSEAPFGGTRRSRIRGALLPSDPPSSSVPRAHEYAAEPEVPATYLPEPDEPGHTSAGAPPDSVHDGGTYGSYEGPHTVTAPPKDGPPEDEPIGAPPEADTGDGYGKTPVDRRYDPRRRPGTDDAPMDAGAAPAESGGTSGATAPPASRVRGIRRGSGR
ncbi:hypothetical protein YWIDRAFT_02973 [Streptomyces sp. SceaMP-e96]|uniref:hypothetical protein n=1 Tax=unclassified Streptomyces TaxID=2593676 RepID=UPI000823A24D|nr:MULTISPECIES: hypothetical protein [unclassified Streptomyces]MYT13631.1 hypothetical protein [Streptomyces sp. SID4951]SCK53129.1 hypothetical protein YWIDRAFT_02973 [Streptomyces sp. SceaMP-e96]